MTNWFGSAGGLDRNSVQSRAPATNATQSLGRADSRSDSRRTTPEELALQGRRGLAPVVGCAELVGEALTTNELALLVRAALALGTRVVRRSRQLVSDAKARAQ